MKNRRLIALVFTSILFAPAADAAEKQIAGIGEPRILRLDKLVSADPGACTYRPEPAADKLEIAKSKDCKPGEKPQIVTSRSGPAASAGGR